MTENKPIIDEIDVSKCKDFHYGECLNPAETVSACENCPNCLFKQLKRKEQEEYETLKLLKNCFDKLNRLQEKNEKLKQALTEIKEIAEPYRMVIKKICKNCEKYNSCHACCYKDISCYKYTSPNAAACDEFTYLDKFMPNIISNQILQIIDEV